MFYLVPLQRFAAACKLSFDPSHPRNDVWVMRREKKWGGKKEVLSPPLLPCLEPFSPPPRSALSLPATSHLDTHPQSVSQSVILPPPLFVLTFKIEKTMWVGKGVLALTTNWGPSPIRYASRESDKSNQIIEVDEESEVCHVPLHVKCQIHSPRATDRQARVYISGLSPWRSSDTADCTTLVILEDSGPLLVECEA